MKHLGLTKKILGIKILRDRDKKVIHLSQDDYIRKVLEKFGMKEAKPVALPLTNNFRLSKTISPQTEEEILDMDRVPYAAGVESLMYTMVYCRPDIAHAISQVSIFMVQPSREY